MKSIHVGIGLSAALCGVLVLASTGRAQRAQLEDEAAQDEPMLPFEASFRKSALIFRGKVLKVDKRAGNDERRLALTRVTIDVLEVLAGHYDGPILEFVLPEGSLGNGIASDVAGTPDFKEGLTYIGFVRTGSWLVSPLLDEDWSLLAEMEVEDRTVLVDPYGRTLLRLGESLMFSSGNTLDWSKIQPIAPRPIIPDARGVSADELIQRVRRSARLMEPTTFEKESLRGAL